GSVTSAPAGITCGTSCAASYASATAVTLTATPASGSIFSGWSGGDCSGTGSCTVIMSAATTVTATFNPDTVAPTVALTAPSAGATVTGTIAVTATAADNAGIVGVQFQLNGMNLGPEVTAVPYAISWDTSTATDGAHTLTAGAR